MINCLAIATLTTNWPYMIEFRAEGNDLNYELHRGHLLWDSADPCKEDSGSGQKPAPQRMESLRWKRHHCLC